MTFYTYMMQNHLGENSPEGNLAADMKSDKDSFPRNGSGKFMGWHRLLRSYLIQNHACSACMDVFEECWERYVACEKKRSNRNS